ncbi:MAG: PEP-CTERM-box response regulator transcription factor [Verrucomicrobiales bacterium]
MSEKNTKPTVLIVDDDEEIRAQMKWALTKEYKVLTAENRADALRQFSKGRPNITLLDLGLPPNPNSPEEGLATLAEVLAEDPHAKVIIVSGQGEKENALRAVDIGAYDFLSKPVDMAELRLVLRRCAYLAGLEAENRSLRDSVQPQVFEGMVAASPEMLGLFKMIQKVAKSDAPVLLLGESGTGKEMAANAIHRQSARKGQPFVAINCSAIPESLIESELFGHEKGAFTDAHAQRLGLIESAEGGTLLLDEIGELSPPVQVKLLRFLQEKCIQRVGGRKEITIDTRVIAATHANLNDEIDKGRFRQDLYFRLAVVELQLPPLRDRGNDVSVLSRQFLQQFAKENGKQNLKFAPETVDAMIAHDWPGNVRELQNRVHRAVIMADNRLISAEDLELTPSPRADGSKSEVSLKEAKLKLERQMVQRALISHEGKVAAAARELGVSRPTLYELMDKLNISKAEPMTKIITPDAPE